MSKAKLNLSNNSKAIILSNEQSAAMSANNEQSNELANNEQSNELNFSELNKQYNELANNELFKAMQAQILELKEQISKGAAINKPAINKPAKQSNESKAMSLKAICFELYGKEQGASALQCAERAIELNICKNGLQSSINSAILWRSKMGCKFAHISGKGASAIYKIISNKPAIIEPSILPALQPFA
jgi:hypothetical protein